MHHTSEVYKPLDETEINQQLEHMWGLIEGCFEASGFLLERLESNPKTLNEVVLRVDKRRQYFLYFHNKTAINEYKLIALYVFWILKLRPFWIAIDDSDDDEFIDFATRINENISLHMFLSIVNNFNASFYMQGADLVKDYADELMYSFRYRDISKEAMYLMLDPFYYMFYFNKSVDSDGEPIL